jgi:hypothetical protein
MKRAIAVVIGVLAMLGAAAGISSAAPGPHGKNDHGLCTAYFNGQKNGHDKKDEDPKPFESLERAGEDYTDNDGVDNDRDEKIDEGKNTSSPDDDESNDLTPQENIYNFCSNTTIIGGNPEHGRYMCTNDGTGDSDPDCQDNSPPGKS